jgi:hypothetical protein
MSLTGPRELTIGELKQKIKGLPEDMPVLLVHNDEGRPAGAKEASVMVVREKYPRGPRVFETWFTPEEFDEVYCDENGAVLPPWTEKDRPPADAVPAFTLWDG